MPSFRRIPHFVISKSSSLHFFVCSNLCITFSLPEKSFSAFLNIAYIFVCAYLHSHLSVPHPHSFTNCCQYFIKRSLAANLTMVSFLSSEDSADSFRQLVSNPILPPHNPTYINLSFLYSRCSSHIPHAENAMYGPPRNEW